MSVATKLVRHATLADLEQLPPTWRGEIIDGTLYAFPRPVSTHAFIEGLLTGDLNDPYYRGRGGPGGWWFLPEPGIRIPRAKEFSPDIAGWRRERLPRLPTSKPITVVPDWICEILSPRTASYDNLVKRRFYAEIGVGHLWYIDPRDKILRVNKLVDGKWVELGIYGGDAKVRAEPFPEAELDLSEWWAGLDEEEEDDAEPTSDVEP